MGGDPRRCCCKHRTAPPEPPPYGDDCECCEPGKTPLYWTVTISGVDANLCTGCHRVDGWSSPPEYGSYNSAATTGIDGKHLLTQDALNPCKWTKTIPNALTIHYYWGGDISCYDEGHAVDLTVDVILELLCVPGSPDTWSFDAYAQFQLPMIGGTTWTWSPRLLGHSEPSGDCVTIDPITDTTACRGGPSPEAHITDGTGGSPPSASFELGDTT